MRVLTVVEAAGLSRLPPDVIRDLIRRSRLPARAVALPSGPAYLIEAADLELFTCGGLSTPDGLPGTLTASRRARLEAALADLQAALARRWSAADVTTPRPGRDDQPPPMPGLPPGRTALGLSQAEISALVARVDGLLTPIFEHRSETDAVSS